MIKKVNIKASVPIKDFRPPIYGTCNGIEMTTGEILKCLCKRAIVDEVLPDGSTIRLDLKNYYTDNTPKTTTEVPAADKVQVVETSVPVDVHDEAPVELEPVVECETATTDVTDAADGVVEVEAAPVEDATTDVTDAVEELVTEDESTAESAVAEVEEAAEEVVAEAEDVVEEVVEEAEPKVDTTANKATTYNNNNGGKKKKKH